MKIDITLFYAVLVTKKSIRKIQIQVLILKKNFNCAYLFTEYYTDGKIIKNSGLRFIFHFTFLFNYKARDNANNKSQFTM